MNCRLCEKSISKRTKSKLCPSCSRKGNTPWNKGLRGFMKGRKVSLETRHKQSISQLGNKNHNWKGGKTPPSQIKGYKYQIWKDAVVARDNSACTICGKLCVYPIAHHIKHAHEYPELIHDVSNGRVVCYDCHMIIHNEVSYYRKRGELRGSLNETTLNQAWKETSLKVQRILAETKEFYSMSVTPTRAPCPKGNRYAELTGDCKKL
jgi:hypothetical protein